MSVTAPAAPRVRRAPSYVSSDGPDAVWFAAQFGMVADDWQSDVVDDWLGRNTRGRLVCSLCGLTVARQNGKNGAVEIRELYGMVQLGERFLHTAHEVKTARKAFKRLKHFFGDRANDPGARYPELNALVQEVRNTNGQEAIILSNGGSVEFVARSKGSGRGFTVDVLVLDEAQDLSEEELEALLPTISAAPLGNPQVVIMGTPPNPEKGQTGEVFTRVRREAESNPHTSFTDFGVVDGPMPDCDDRKLWRRTNPALGTRLQESVLVTERSMMSDAGFARERLGWWGDPATAKAGVIDLVQWAFLLRAGAKQPGRAAVFLDVSPDRTWSSLGVAGAGKQGRTLVLTRTKPGTSWVVPALEKLVKKRDVVEVALHPGTQAGALIPLLLDAGIEYSLVTTAESGRACAAFQNAVKDGTLEHVGQAELDAAVGNARTRWSQEAELWDRRDASIDISPLVAASGAAFRWGLLADYDVMDSIH